jgi:hypothetical protein
MRVLVLLVGTAGVSNGAAGGHGARAAGSPMHGPAAVEVESHGAGGDARGARGQTREREVLWNVEPGTGKRAEPAGMVRVRVPCGSWVLCRKARMQVMVVVVVTRRGQAMV